MNDLNKEVQVFLNSKIFFIDGISYILDSDLAEFYGMETKKFNEVVKRNLDRFDSSFIIQLTKEQVDTILPKKEGRGWKTYLPYAFTFEGTVLLCGLVNTPIAIEKAKYVAKEFVRLKLLEKETQNQVSQFATKSDIDIIKNDIERVKTGFVSKDEFTFFVEKILENIDKKGDTPQPNTIGFSI